MGKIVLEVPGWLPERINVLLRAHWAKQRKLGREAAAVVGAARLLAGVPAGCKTKRSVSVVYSQPRGSADPDARWKQLLDALVKAGLLKDDSQDWCVPLPPVTVRGPRGTVVTLEDLG